MNRSIAILLLGLSLTGCVEARSVVPADGPGPLLVAHRAGTADYPENTLLRSARRWTTAPTRYGCRCS